MTIDVTASERVVSGSEKTKRIVLVTGPSGAGRSTAINVLEDLDYEVIDNLPLSFLPRLLDGPPLDRPLALGIDVRNRDFSANAMIQTLADLAARPDVLGELLYLDCATEVLLRRYSETRRRHPMAPAESPQVGIERELDLLAPIRVRADVLIDTSELTPHELRSEIQSWFRAETTQLLSLSLHSFSYKRGMPSGVDMVFDVRFLRNPYWDATLRPEDGRSEAVQTYIEADPLYPRFFEQICDLALLLLPAYRDEGKAHLSIAFGCTGGQHRSVALAEGLGRALVAAGWPVSIRHRELERRGKAAAPEQNGQVGRA